MRPYQSLTEKFDHLITYRGRNVYDGEHSISEFEKHFPGLDIASTYIKALKQGIDVILTQYNDVVDNYVIRSKRYGFGIQLDWRGDRYDDSKPCQGFTATTLGKDDTKFYTRKDKIIFVEQIHRDGVVRVDSEFSERTIHYDVDVADVGYIRLTPPPHLNESMVGYDVFMENGEIFRTFEIIDVE